MRAEEEAAIHAHTLGPREEEDTREPTGFRQKPQAYSTAHKLSLPPLTHVAKEEDSTQVTCRLTHASYFW